MALKLITAPTIKPLTLAETKIHLRVDSSDEDILINLLIDAATAYADGPTGFLGRALCLQTWDVVLDAFPTNEIKIPIPPLINVVSVSYDDPAGNAQAVSPNDYTVDNSSEPGWVVPGDTWPATFDGINSVRVRFTAGYSDGVPADIKAGLLLYIGSMFANREHVAVGQSAMELPWGAEQLLRRKRIDLSMA